MGIFIREKAQETQFSYAIYIIVCLLITGILAYNASFDSASRTFNSLNMTLQLIQNFIWASIAWILGKKVKLQYIWICVIALLGSSLILILDLLRVLFYDRFSSDVLTEITFAIAGVLFFSLILALVVFIISYPLQLLIFKYYYK